MAFQPDRPAGASDFEFRDAAGNIRKFSDLTPEEKAAGGAKAMDTIDKANKEGGGVGLVSGTTGGEAAKNQSMAVERNAEAAGVNVGGTQTSAGGIGGFFGEKAGMSIYTPGVSTDPNYAANRARINALADTVSARPAAQMQGATVGALNTADQDATRTRQNALLDQLMAASNGQGPSAAQQQLKMGADRNMAGALAMAAAQGTPGAARQAAFQRASITQDAAGQSAMLRAQEINDARGLLGQTAQGVRGQDLGLIGMQQTQQATQAQLAQDTAKTNLITTIDQQRMKDELVQRYLAMGMSADQANMQAEVQQRQYAAGLLAQQEAAAKGISIQNAAQGIQVAGAVAGAIGTAGASLAGNGMSALANDKATR